MISNRRVLSAIAVSTTILMGSSHPPHAQAAESLTLEQTVAPSNCDTPQHHQFDFWIGDWQVFDADTNQLVGFDRVTKHHEGCIVEQDLSFLTDLYRRPGVAYRLAGISINRFDGDSWVQMWADNQWGAIVFHGGLDAHGAMVLVTVVPSRNRDVKIVFERRADGSIRNLEYVAPAGTGKWQKYGDLIYRPNR